MTREPLTLALEGSTYEGSVALLEGADVIAERSLHDDDAPSPLTGRGERLLPAVAECIESAGIKAQDITRIVCGAGPGRFTSLRIAGSAAKGLATGLNAELFAISSLTLIVSAARPALRHGEYLSVLDAMRGEWFVARVSVATDGGIEEKVPARIVSAAELEAMSADPNLRVIGPGQSIDARPHARGVAPLVSRILADGPVDLASWEPDYGRLPEAQVRREALDQGSTTR
ncbi:MAG: tRNA (adenosine(37)-N6)-threonylcarbamoyltransferase complex dimerization subunit type 1 TsaB [Gemmatimonadota bacterium]|nr:tRNA (adenosine(37)-N6)-threonylcarbamoyltransferase complex dimerization subunit type 1 TsaB [Gemmatimonadota bacterium]